MYVFHTLGKHECEMMLLRASSTEPQVIFSQFYFRLTVQAKLRIVENEF